MKIYRVTVSEEYYVIAEDKDDAMEIVDDELGRGRTVDAAELTEAPAAHESWLRLDNPCDRRTIGEAYAALKDGK